MGTVTEVGSLYSTPVGFVYVFNLIVGAGVLTMPKAFADVGWLLGILLLFILAFTSFVTATLMVEAMAAANAVLQLRKQQREEQQDERSHLLPYSALGRKRVKQPHALSTNRAHADDSNVESESPLVSSGEQGEGEVASSLFEINDRVEMGTMAKIFFTRAGVALYYVCVCIYLYGDLAIYAVAVPKALANATCYVPPPAVGPNTTNGTNASADFYYGDLDSPEENAMYSLEAKHKNRSTTEHYCFGAFTDHRAYWLFLGIFALVLGPFTFFDLQKTKIMQLVTTVLRWFAFISMISLAGRQIAKHGSIKLTNTATFVKVPNMFGVAIYSFMCQHSLPSLVTPIRQKKGLSLMLFGDFALVLSFYVLVNFTAIFAFDKHDLQDEYSNNFTDGIAPKVMSYFLRLFPVFVLSTNFPIISITLRNNLKALFLDPTKSYSFTVERLVFPVAALLPPLVIAFSTQDLETLVGYTGSYAGVGVQYLIPVAFVYCARRQLPSYTGHAYSNMHMSPFSHGAWLMLVVIWSVACIVFNTVNHILGATSAHHIQNATSS